MFEIPLPAKLVNGLLIAAVLSVVSFGSLAATAGTTSCTSDERLVKMHREKTRDGLLLSEEIEISLHGVRFRMPHGYNLFWTKKENLELYEDSSGTTRTRAKFSGNRGYFAYWMPDKDWPHFDSGRGSVFWKCSDKNAFLIRFYLLNPFLGEALGPRQYTMPDMSYRNVVGGTERWLASKGGHLTYGIRFGLNEIFYESRLSDPLGSIYYKNKADDKRQVFISCHTDAYHAPYKTCTAYVYWPDGLGVRIDFLKEAMPSWEAIIESAHELAVSWRH